jgi:murein L,D-transpeptidase YcbB/YkuD
MTTEPIYPQYAQLKAVLKKYRAIEEAGGWPIIKADRSFYRKGDSSLALAVVRRRLFASGEFMGDTASFVFDDALESAVKDFQQRNGLKEDGVISTAVLKELNFPVAKRIEQLVVNMERCRWLPVAIRNNYIVINIPEYKFHAFEQDSLAWSMNVVVGTELNKTAIFNGLIQTVVFSPYWNVPTSIMQKETLPAIRRDKNYMARNHMEWNGNGIRKVPGPWNALGRVKFLFPNSHSIYLHDTQAKSLFGLDKRAFSHGCIRVAEPKRLAEYLLRFQPEWTSDKIDAAMNSGKEQFVKINKPVPVYIAYFTAWVDRKGRVNFRDDVYRRDSRLAKMLFENSAP